MNYKQLSPTDARPLYIQLKEILRDAIQQGAFKKGERIPPELELSRTYGVSRITVRNALEELTQEGLLVRRQGKGTFVTQQKFTRRITKARSFTQICEEMGCRPGAKVIKSVIEEANEEEREIFALKPEEKIINIERIRYTDDIPVAIEASHFPESYAFLLGEDLNDCSLFQLLREKYGIQLENSSKTLELTFASYEMSRYLNIAKGYPLLYIDSVLCDQQDNPSHRSMQYIVGDKFKLVL